MGYVWKAVLDRFDWRNIALFTNDDYSWRKCYYAKQGFLDIVSGTELGLATSYDVKYPGKIPQFEFANFWKLAILDARS